jgi:glucose-6-phosphate 1-dehydrogenase
MNSMTFVLFGATGDLAKRKIFPALFNLFVEGKLPKNFLVVGLGRRELTPTGFRENIKSSLLSFSRRKPESIMEIQTFVDSFIYCSLHITNQEDYVKLLNIVQKNEKEKDIKENRMFYLAVSPDYFDVIADNIQRSGLGSTTGWKRLIIEKPFGQDLQTAQELNKKLSQGFNEDEIYRIDHYLGKGMVQNLDALRFSNSIFEPFWNKQYIKNVQITASETVGVEERAGYYDHVGALKDMMQNHLFQMLMMVAMEQPEEFSTNAVHEEKKKLLEALRLLQVEQVSENVIRGQYGKGSINEVELVGYKEEPGVREESETETFVAARLFIDNDRWDGVPFYLRTGKRMQEKITKIVIEYNKTPNQLVGLNGELNPNLLVIQINPIEGVTFQLNSKDQHKIRTIEPINVTFLENSKDVPEGYERLIYDALRGDSTYFAHWDEVEGSWKWLDVVLQAFKNGIPLFEYPSGSTGPTASDNLLKKDGNHWL